jgi:AAA ATPase domain
MTTVGDLNPFSPTFGQSPAVVVGREQLLELVSRAFVPGSDPARKTLLRAYRGSGKTVLLNEIQDLATAAGWLVIQEDAAPASVGLIERLMDRIRAPLDSDSAPKRKVTGVQGQIPILGGIGIDFEDKGTVEPRRTLRTALEDRFTSSPTLNGILLSVDEIHEASRAEIQEIGNAVQQLDRDHKPIAVALAGLPLADEEQEPTFLSRCFTPSLSTVPDDEIARGLQETAQLSGWAFTHNALRLAVEVAAGYPYMMQLIGWESFERARATNPGTIEARHVEAATDPALRRLNRSVLFSLDKRVSTAELAFLFAMAQDSQESRMRDIAERMGQSPQYANVYRQRLLDAGLIVQIDRGVVDFAIPGHRSKIRADQAYGANRAGS